MLPAQQLESKRLLPELRGIQSVRICLGHATRPRHPSPDSVMSMFTEHKNDCQASCITRAPQVSRYRYARFGHDSNASLGSTRLPQWFSTSRAVAECPSRVPGRLTQPFDNAVVRLERNAASALQLLADMVADSEGDSGIRSPPRPASGPCLQGPGQHRGGGGAGHLRAEMAGLTAGQ